MKSILLLYFTMEETGMQSSKLPKVTEPVSELESRVHALNLAVQILADTRRMRRNQT